MNKLDMESKDIVNENIQKISELFPNVIVESDTGKTIDFDLLKQELNRDIVEGVKEKYQLTWPGKKEAIVNANTPSKNTLRPVKEKSVNFDNTQNIYIEGDNLEVLKILQESYLNKIKCIYIDPPYNTGNDFIYNDKFKKDIDKELLESGQVDEEGNRMVTNNQSNGRFHSDWLSMMYPRLKLARNLLTDDGVIFISIDDNEVDNLKKISNEIFGENNFIGNVVRVAKTTSFRGNFFSPSKDYLICYGKNISCLKQFTVQVNNDNQFKKIEVIGERKGEYYRDDIAFYLSTLETRPNQRYYIECPDGELVLPPGTTRPINSSDGEKVLPNVGDGVWRWEHSNYFLKKDLLVFKRSNRSPLLNQDGNQAKWNIYTKSYLKDKIEKGNIPRDLFENFLNRNGSEELSKLNIPFSFPKPSKLVKYLLSIVNIDKNSIILDFFSGSATTAHAVMQLNSEDNGNRKYIMVQLPEKCEENSEAYRNGYKTICEIGEERIRRAGAKIKEETDADIDYGFRVYKVDSSNMKDVYYMPNDLEQGNLSEFESNIKEDRTTDDLLTQVILDLGLSLDLKIEEKMIGKNKVYYVAGNSLVACFDDKIDIDIVDKICKCEPYKVVFKDSAFRTDNDKINLEERFKKLLPQRANDSGVINII